MLGRSPRRGVAGRLLERRRSRHAAIMADAGVDTDHGGCWRRELGDQLRDRRRRTRPGARPAPRSWSATAAPGRRAIRRLIRDSGSPGTASMNASSTTSTRPGRTSRSQDVGRVQHAGRVGRVADDHQVGVVRDPVGIEPELRGPGRGAPVAGRARRRAGGLRLGELRVDDHRPPPTPSPGQQRERLGRAGGGQHPVTAHAVRPGDRPRRRRRAGDSRPGRPCSR